MIHVLEQNRLTVDWLRNWSPETVYKHLDGQMPYFVSLLTAFIHGGRNSERTQNKTPMVCTYSTLYIQQNV